jgi:hypothetical protein
MVYFAACLALLLTCVDAMSRPHMSISKQLQQHLVEAEAERLSQTAQAAQAPAPRNFLVLRLAHTGSSWLTAMIGAQEDTYVTREAMFPTSNQEYIDHVESLGNQGVIDYLERAFTVPSGSIYTPDELQFFCNTTEEAQEKAEAGTNALPAEAGLPPAANLSLISQAVTVNTFMQPKTCDCLRNQGPECPLKFLGMTLDPTSQGLKYALNEILTAISQKHPDMHVLVLRRSNIVKLSLATGGMTENLNGSTYNVWLHRDFSVDRFMMDLRLAVNDDQVLLDASQLFNHVKLVTYEDLFEDPQKVMNPVFDFFGMQGRFEDWMGQIGDKHTPDDLRLLINNFDELEYALEQVSPCLAKQLRATTNEKFPEPCGDFWH